MKSLSDHRTVEAKVHYPGLDTLRACAILLVIPRHAWEILKWPWLKVFFGNHGWVGVDLFFVLSGFLIGSQVMKSARQTGRVDFLNFYFKRFMRILPAYFAVLALYFVWPSFGERPMEESAWRYILFVMNFGPKAQAFSHAWSLCVEEHFYLFFPLIVAIYASHKKFVSPRTLILTLLCVGVALRLALYLGGAPFYPDLYRPTYVHLDGLVVGVSLALIHVHRPLVWQKLIAIPWVTFIFGLVVLSLGLWIFGGARSQPSIYAAMLTYPLVSIGFGAMVLSCVSPDFWLAKYPIPGAGALAALAYTLYLTHKQMINLAAQMVGSPSENQLAIITWSIVLMAIASCLLYFCIERPALKLRDRMIKAR